LKGPEAHALCETVDNFKADTLTEIHRRFHGDASSDGREGPEPLKWLWQTRSVAERRAVQQTVDAFKSGEYLAVVADYRVVTFFGFSVFFTAFDFMLGRNDHPLNMLRRAWCVPQTRAAHRRSARWGAPMLLPVLRGRGSRMGRPRARPGARFAAALLYCATAFVPDVLFSVLLAVLVLAGLVAGPFIDLAAALVSVPLVYGPLRLRRWKGKPFCVRVRVHLLRYHRWLPKGRGAGSAGTDGDWIGAQTVGSGSATVVPTQDFEAENLWADESDQGFEDAFADAETETGDCGGGGGRKGSRSSGGGSAKIAPDTGEPEAGAAAAEAAAGRLNLNRAFVFVKPHAMTEEVKQLVRTKFAENGIAITGEGTIKHDDIDARRLIDVHYGAIAAKAMRTKPADLHATEKAQAAFASAFGASWAEALAGGLVFNASDARARLGVDGAGLNAEWVKLEMGVGLVKFGGGFYVGSIMGIYVVNGFYMAMRGKYTTAPASIHYFTAEWSAAGLSWGEFRGTVLGATDPAKAAAGSIRRTVLEQWEALGLPGVPSTADNGVHASASPFEALSERMNWLGQSVAGEDGFGAEMASAGLSAETIAAWRGDPQVKVPGGGGAAVSLFDALEDMDSRACVLKCAAIDALHRQQVPQQAIAVPQEAELALARGGFGYRGTKGGGVCPCGGGAVDELATSGRALVKVKPNLCARASAAACRRERARALLKRDANVCHLACGAAPCGGVVGPAGGGILRGSAAPWPAGKPEATAAAALRGHALHGPQVWAGRGRGFRVSLGGGATGWRYPSSQGSSLGVAKRLKRRG
jgi:nucleoside diphosphate kinase